MIRVGAEERARLLRLGKLNLRLHNFLNCPAYDDPLWDRLFTALIYFLMGIIESLGGVTGLYFSEAVVWLGCQHAIATCKIEDWLGTEKDPELSQHIVDPRNRMAALDAIERSRDVARSK